MEQVAERARVSKSLVSRYLNERPGVGADSAGRIKEAIDHYHYRLPGTAEGSAIAIMLGGLSNFHRELLEACSGAALERGFVLTAVYTFGSREMKERCAELLAQGCVRGVIVYGSSLDDQDAIEILLQNEVPVVLVENDLPQVEAEKILVDNFRGQYELTRLIIEAGYKDIRMVPWGMSTRAGAERLSGFLAALREYGRAQGNSYIYPLETLSYEGAFEIVQRLHALGNMPEVFVCGGDTTAQLIMSACIKLGYNVPGDIAVTGFDGDSDEFLQIWTPKLTTMKQPLREIGVLAVDRLAEHIAEPQTPVKTTVFEAVPILGDTARINID